MMNLEHKLRQVKERYDELNQAMSDPSVFDRPKEYAELTIEHTQLRELVEDYGKLMDIKHQLKGNQELISQEEGTHTAVFHPSEDVLFNQFSASTIPNVARISSTDGKLIATLKTAKNPYEDVKIGSAEVKAIKAKDKEFRNRNE